MASKSFNLYLRKTNANYSHTVELYLNERSQSIVSNQTIIDYTVTFKTPSQSGYHYNYNNRLWLTIDGNVLASSEDVGSINIGSNSSKQIKSGTITITHDADGNKTIPIYMRFRQMPESTAVYDSSISDSWALTRIPRASTVTFSSGGHVLGEAMTLTVNSADSSFRHNVTFSHGGTTETIATNVGSGNLTWTPAINYATRITNSMLSDGIVTCHTYDGNGNALGTSQSTLTLQVPYYVPVLTASVEATNLALDRCVQGFSGAVFAFSATTSYGASIQGYTIDGISRVSGYEIPVITASGEVSWTVKVTDSRGQYASQTLTLTVYPYAMPDISRVSIYRSDAQGVEDESGTYIGVKAHVTISDVNGQNSIATFKARYHATGSETWIADATNLTNDSVNVLTSLFDAGTAYSIQLFVTDAVGNTGYSIVIAIPVATVPFNIRDNGSGIGLGKYCEHDDAFEINEDWAVNMGMNLLMSGLRVIPVVASSVSNASGYVKYANGLTLAWKQFERDNYPITKAWGSIYENTNDDLVFGDMPNKGTDAEFTATPVVFATPCGGNSAIIASVIGTNTTSWGRAWVVRGVQLANTEVAINLLAVGFSAVS